MGQIAGKFLTCTDNIRSALSAGRKRKYSESVGSEDEPPLVEPPKRRKLLTTTKYIYNALYKDQRNSDISVRALNRTWRLHKIYLAQSPYFEAMFNGSWSESSMNYVNMQILDEQINIEALDAVFGSLYCDEISIGAENVVAILATATLLQLQSIIDKCAECMIEHTAAENAVQSYEAACRYGLLPVKEATFNWLSINLLNCYYNTNNYKYLRLISIDLMTKLVGNHDLYVLQTEFSLYQLLRVWMFLKLNPNCDPNNTSTQQQLNDAQKLLTETGCDVKSSATDILQWIYFLNREDGRSFLETPDGAPYMRTFKKLRTHYLANHYMDMRIVMNDNIIPKEWMHRHVLSNWEALLKIDHANDGEPQNVSQQDFDAYAMRCSRFLEEAGFHKWRWTGFNFGLDIIFIMDSGEIRVKRLHRYETQRIFSMRAKRNFMIRLKLSTLDAKHCSIFTQTTEIQSLCLDRNEEATIMKLDEKAKHPMIISASMLMIPPTDLDFKEFLPNAEELSYHANVKVPIFELGGSYTDRPVTPTLTQDASDSALETSSASEAASHQRNACCTMQSTPNARPRIGVAASTNSSS